MFEVRISHTGLNAFRVVKGQTRADVEMKAASQISIWEERWERQKRAKASQNARQRQLEARKLSTDQLNAAKNLALEKTRELESQRASLESILRDGLDHLVKPDWNSHKESSPFTVPRPTRAPSKSAPREPLESDTAFAVCERTPVLGLLDKLIRSRRESRIKQAAQEQRKALEDARTAFDAARDKWHVEYAEWSKEQASDSESYKASLEAWEEEKADFDAARKLQHESIDLLKAEYFAGTPHAVEMYVEDILAKSSYPDFFPKEHRLQYDQAAKSLIIDFELPDQRALPSVKEIKYVAARGEFQDVPISETWTRKAYDEMLYQTALRTVYEVFTWDVANAMRSITFNGWVRSIDKATGADTHACIMSLEAGKEEFLAINLMQVDFKACFKKLKGVAASKLSELSPVKPLAAINKEDSRFVEGYGVIAELDDRTNLAAMDWLDFENLIREVFEKEFGKGGGEVRITQASRDGGVDAIAYDPDPIRGGKWVIQAKRYTNTVGVSAVRDLYGTVHNEGANKGILVTTSDFGPDAYSFAKDKPLTLISGGELLYLLQQHGHSAKIDLAEAKRIAAEAASK